LNILDDNNDETGDGATLSSFDATLYLNGNQIVLDGLGLSGGSRTTVGNNSLNDTATQILSGLSGNNTISLQYTGTATATWKIAGIANNRTADAALWGSDGTMDGTGEFTDGFDNYSTSTARNADGLFVDGVVTLQSVPEPASVLMLALGGGLVALKRRFFGR
jgi:hypothetical protein